MITVLVVDDDPAIQRTLAIGLRAQGYDVLPARDGRTAVDACHDDEPDVVLLDLGLPGLDGRGVVAALKADPRTAKLPIIVVTAAAGDDTRHWALRLGCSDFLEKPVELRTLTEAVVRCLEKAA